MIKEIMSYVLTFVSAFPQKHPLDDDFLDLIYRENGIDTGNHHWLHPEKAVDIALKKPLTLTDIKNLRDILASRQIDVFFNKTEGRKKKLLLADMDSTIVVGETLDDLSAFAGVKDRVEKITERAMNGEIEFEAALRERVGLLKDLSLDALEKTAMALQIMNGAKTLIAVMKKNGAKTVLVTGGFTYFADDVGEEVGFESVHGNVLEIIDGKRLSGNVIPPILDKNSKLSYLKSYAAEYHLDLSETFAIGDGANDLPMLTAAGMGIGYHPKQVVRETVINVILHGDLSAALYAQGYSESEIII